MKFLFIRFIQIETPLIINPNFRKKTKQNKKSPNTIQFGKKKNQLLIPFGLD